MARYRWRWSFKPERELGGAVLTSPAATRTRTAARSSPAAAADSSSVTAASRRPG